MSTITAFYDGKCAWCDNAIHADLVTPQPIEPCTCNEPKCYACIQRKRGHI